MICWHYDPQTGALLGSDWCDFSPLEPGVPLVPAFATRLPPPPFDYGQWPAFHDGAWLVMGEPLRRTENVALESIPSVLARLRKIAEELQKHVARSA